MSQRHHDEKLVDELLNAALLGLGTEVTQESKDDRRARVLAGVDGAVCFLTWHGEEAIAARAEATTAEVRRVLADFAARDIVEIKEVDGEKKYRYRP